MKNIKASITYEAALVLPLFTGILIFFLSFFKFLLVQEVISSAVFYIADEASLYGFASWQEIEENTEKENDLYHFLLDIFYNAARETASSVYFTSRLRNLVPADQIEKQFVKNGIQGISFIGSDLLEQDHVIIKLQYSFIFPVFERLIPPIKVQQKITVRSFSGHKIARKGTDADEETMENKVYVTETGQVYHIDKNCTYIKLSIKEASRNEIDILRSDGGGKYYECSICDEVNQNNKQVYYTEYGSRFHNTLNCSGIKRNVSVIDMSKIGNKRPCSKCAVNH